MEHSQNRCYVLLLRHVHEKGLWKKGLKDSIFHSPISISAKKAEKRVKKRKSPLPQQDGPLRKLSSRCVFHLTVVEFLQVMAQNNEKKLKFYPSEAFSCDSFVPPVIFHNFSGIVSCKNIIPQKVPPCLSSIWQVALFLFSGACDFFTAPLLLFSSFIAKRLPHFWDSPICRTAGVWAPRGGEGRYIRFIAAAWRPPAVRTRLPNP